MSAVTATAIERAATHAVAARAALAARDEAIREAVAEGASLRTVADAVGLSHGGVARIVHRT